MKKYLLITSLLALVAVGGLLTGCGVKQKANTNIENPPLEQVAPIEEQAAAPAPITDADIDQELKGLDASMDTVKVTGFEDSSLSDKDLGL